MNYTKTEIEGQNLAFKIDLERDLANSEVENISFVVVCSNNETEIPDLITDYLNFLDGNIPTPTYDEIPTQIDVSAQIAEQQSLIQNLQSRLAALETANTA